MPGSVVILAFKIWYAVKQNVQDKGDAFFNEDVKGFELPGDSVPSKTSPEP